MNLHPFKIKLPRLILVFQKLEGQKRVRRKQLTLKYRVEVA